MTATRLALLAALALTGHAAQLRSLQGAGGAAVSGDSKSGSTSLQALPGAGPRGPGGGPVTCVTRGQTLKRGSCSSFSETFKEHADQYINLSDQDFLKIVNSNPQPSSQCCTDSRNFITNGCTCDPAIMHYNEQQGLSDNQLKAVVRATQLSQCSWPANGGWISDPCNTVKREVLPSPDNSGNSIIYDGTTSSP